MNKFNFTDQEIDSWKDKPINFDGHRGVGVVLIHGWSAMPKQLKNLATFLSKEGYSVSVPILKGHGSRPENLVGVVWKDWLEDVRRSIEEMKYKPQVNKIVVAGASMGGNLALLESQKTKIDGLILIGTPVHLKNHFWIWLGTWLMLPFKKFIKKNYPQKVQAEKKALGVTSYQYFPVKSVAESLAVIRKSIFSLKKVTVPTLILQTNSDYLVAKYSPWVIFNAISSKTKRLQWLKSQNGSHILISEKTPDFFSSILNFLEEINIGKN